ncbi:MAG: hypothetical protein AB1635_02200 [Acidobacteriota bacterium]
MNKVLWTLGEVIVGFLLAGVAGGVVVPAAVAVGVPLGPWFIWVALVLCVTGAILAGERLRADLARGRAPGSSGVGRS